jgi:hypothetical protein
MAQRFKPASRVTEGVRSFFSCGQVTEGGRSLQNDPVVGLNLRPGAAFLIKTVAIPKKCLPTDLEIGSIHPSKKSRPSGNTVAGETVMFPATYFVQTCPICGRSLQIRLEYLGRSVACQHCQGSFMAIDPAMQPVEKTSDSGDDLLARADELLATSGIHRIRPR